MDRQVQGKVATALQAVEEALAVCRQARRSGGVEAHRAPRVVRDLSRAKVALSNVRRLTPLYDVEDPDLRQPVWQPPPEEGPEPEEDVEPEPEPVPEPEGD